MELETCCNGLCGAGIASSVVVEPLHRHCVKQGTDSMCVAGDDQVIPA